MQQTYKLFKSIADKQFQQYTDLELCNMYKSEDFFNDPRILATMFIRHYGFIHMMGSQFVGDSDDFVSMCTELLDKSIKKFESGHGTFITYYGKVLKNAIINHKIFMSTYKNKSMTESINIESTINDDSSTIQDLGSYFNLCEEDKNFENIEYLEYLNSLPLKPKYKKYCILLYKGYSNPDISKYLKVSTVSLCNWRKHIRKILNSYEIT